MARFIMSLAMFASFTWTALADLAPPPPKEGFKRVPYENLLKLETEIPDYKFYSFQRLGIGGKETIGDELKLGTKSGIPVPSSSSPSVRTGLVAVPQKVMEELKTKENLAKLLYRGYKDKLPAGVVVYETSGTTRDLKSSDRRTKVENVISVSHDEKTGVRFSSKETPEPQNQNAAPKTSSRPLLGTLIASLTMALSIVTLGIWIFRRNPRAINGQPVKA